MLDVTLKPPAHPRTSQCPSYTDISPGLPKTSIPSLHGKKNHRALLWPGATPPLQRLFLSIECGSKLLSQPLQRATTGPWSLGTAEGVEPGGRGAYTSHNIRPAGGKRKCTGSRQKDGEKEEEESAFERCFQLLDKSPCFVKATRGEKAQQQKRKTKGAQNLPCLLSDLEVEGMRLKALGLLPKKTFILSKKSKCWQTTVRQGGWGQKFHYDTVLSCILSSDVLLLFLSVLRGNW